MEPIYENIQANHGSSFYIHSNSPGCCEPFWHIHPEYELVYIKSGSAERHVGSNVARYNDGDLLLIGSNIPHSNLGNQDKDDNYEIVIQLSTEFINQRILPFPEFTDISKLMERSSHGISFGHGIKEQVGPALKHMVELPAFEKLICLMQALQTLANTNDYHLLHATKAAIEVQSNDYSRINRINTYVSEHYQKPIQIKELAELTGLTETSFSRFFKKVTGKTFINFLNEFRIQKACTLLSNKNTSISDIMMLSGFVEPAYFTRIFKRYTNFSPREYRKKVRNW
ncbi:helix-turn-helix domain-containing protein [Carboxylicivirga sp. N1Y90]|uniref:helix-turn-helix domain-containing protein n=1 Tax=Carboxylicivirga fragile TaxID=3417571 RepID=UPI003D3552E0|nr:helix-turn-helix domain-containing protein [Marinilabiliaceae bacterium N1Y90]